MDARIVAVADVFDALTSRRPYKEAWTVDAATAGRSDGGELVEIAPEPVRIDTKDRHVSRVYRVRASAVIGASPAC